MQKYASSAVLLLLFCFSHLFANQRDSFERCMGEGTSAWQHLRTPEDFKKLQFFKGIYERGKPFLKEVPKESKIPKIIHFIWLGPKECYFTHLEGWAKQHPDWTVKFWTDVDWYFPYERIEKHLIQEFPFSRLVDQYYKSDNYGEKSHLLKYMLLLEEGGVYVDCDTISERSLDAIHSAFDFYCGLEPLGDTVLSSSVFCSPHLIAARPHHPILEYTVDWLEKNWDFIEKSYPGSDSHSIYYRVMHRTGLAFEEGVGKNIGQQGNNDMVFPATYFSMQERMRSQYTIHVHNKTWYTDSNTFEYQTAYNFNQVTQKTKEALLITLFSSLLTILAFIGLFFYIQRVKRTT